MKYPNMYRYLYYLNKGWNPSKLCKVTVAHEANQRFGEQLAEIYERRERAHSNGFRFYLHDNEASELRFFKRLSRLA